MSLIEWASWVKAIIRMSDLHLGHSKGSISYMRFMHAAQVLLVNSLLWSVSIVSV